MRDSTEALDFELAAILRDEIKELREGGTEERKK